MQIMDDRLDEVARNLRANPIFKSMGAVEAVSVLKAGTTMACGEGEVLFAEGDPCDGFYVVLSGRFGVMGVRDGEPLALAIIGPGECIGEMSLTRATPRSATVRRSPTRRCGTSRAACSRRSSPRATRGPPTSSRASGGDLPPLPR
ncbi:MAG: cyclic nucleotide-binding domain-containing protein [Deltaproteobacteria bacterium]|nr:cyclic nucleotide-binding domain-containing protein [Deltaproteobacteria bacterium]